MCSRIPASVEKKQQEPTTTAISELQQFQHQLKAIKASCPYIKNSQWKRRPEIQTQSHKNCINLICSNLTIASIQIAASSNQQHPNFSPNQQASMLHLAGQPQLHGTGSIEGPMVPHQSACPMELPAVHPQCVGGAVSNSTLASCQSDEPAPCHPEPYPVVEVELADAWMRKNRSQSEAFPKHTSLKSSGTPPIFSQVKMGEVPQSGYENTPDSDPLDVVSCSRDQAVLEPGLGLHLTVASPLSDTENSVNSVDADLIAQLPVPSVGCNSPDPCSPSGPSFAEILCRGLDTISQGFLVGGVSSRPISEDDRTGALGPMGASIKLEPHPPDVPVPDLDPALSCVPSVSERAIKPCCVPLSDVDAPPVVAAAALKLPPGSSPVQCAPGPSAEIDPDITPDSISRIVRNHCLIQSDPAGRISPISCEPLDVNRPDCSDVDYAETMPPSESGCVSVPALSTVYPDYGAVDSTAVTRAFSAAFHLGSPDQWNEDELFARQAINGWQRMARWHLFVDAAGMADLDFGVRLLLLLRGQVNDAEAVFSFLQWPH
ncbi:hypothetical protein Nepgr_005378 [Nepenthes gracilis]|uniref:Uncharacterized protein n=1 Tax=Nepenthes gracilis TaxID=150966 RepID=A0AAD3XG91_NEPGR|nr:hypothetical protein Nepgr_005378 [Nepenthes gracilis]